MIHQLTYTNSLGESVTFGGRANPLFYGDADIFNIKQAYKEIGGSIVSFEYETTEMGLMAHVRGATQADIDRIIDVLTYDRRVGQAGTLYAGQSFMRCYVAGTNVTNWHQIEGMADIELTIVSDTPVWVRKVNIELGKHNGESIGAGNYPNNYKRNYLYSAGTSQRLTNPFMLPAKCDITIPGACVSPYVIIGNNRYQVDVTVSAGQLLIIRGYGKRDVIIRHNDGTERSVFANRVRGAGANVFAEIPVGNNVAAWSGSYNVDIAMYEERAYPVW